MSCLDENAIVALTGGQVSPLEREQIKQHLDSCAACRDAVAAVTPADLEKATLADTLAASALGPERPPVETLRSGAMVSRYVILSVIGAGGMGVVYAAYDPELNRKIAVKLLRPTTHGNANALRTRLLHEAQAMARLQHPNVVAVYDVGTYGDEVFIAMEYVEGVTLTQWLSEKPRRWREVTDALVAAGRALAAAHAAGIVHRDFKPDNVILGADHRVRVLDFGLARSAQAEPTAPSAPAPEVESQPLGDDDALTLARTDTRWLAGTPLYMSPEQWKSLPVDAYSDQFSFCVTLFEALHGVRPFAAESAVGLAQAVVDGEIRRELPDQGVPAWLHKIVVRGLSADPGARYASMEALLAALTDDPAQRRRRWLLLAGVLAVLASAAIGYRAIERGKSALCTGAEKKWAGIWDAQRKQEVHTAFAATHAVYAEDSWRFVERALDAYVRDWVTMHTDSCEATRIRGEQSEELLDLRADCLEDRRREMRAQVDVLVVADAKTVQRAARATQSLGSISACADTAALKLPMRPPPDAETRARVEKVRGEVARARAMRNTSKYKEGLAVAVAAVDEAAAVHYRPVEAEALLQLGFLQHRSGDLRPAEQTFQKSLAAAIASRSGPVAAQAWVGLLAVAADSARYDEAQAAGRLALATLDSFGGSDVLLRYVLEQLGNVSDMQGKYDEALQHYRSATAVGQRIHGTDQAWASGPLVGEGNVLFQQGKYDEALASYRRALPIVESTLGSQHPDLGALVLGLGNVFFRQHKYAEAVEQYERVRAIWEATLDPKHPDLALVMNNIATVYQAQGKYDEALAMYRTALARREAALGPQHPDVASTLSNIGVVLNEQGKYGEALVSLRRALTIKEAALGSQHPSLVTTLEQIGVSELGEHRPAAALEVLTRAYALPAQGDPGEVAELRFALARALWETHRDRPRALQLAEEARAAYAAAGADSKKDLAEVEAWLRPKAQ
jgi:tetratricopeptide (TPR) repeat protein/predicted Ser/Thr protein kinase